MTERSEKMVITIIVVLGAAVIQLSAVTVYLATVCRQQAKRAADAQETAYAAEQDVKELISEKIKLIEINERAEQRIQVLTSLNETLLKRAVIKRVPEKQEQAEPAQEDIQSKDGASLLPAGHTNTYRCEDFGSFAKNSHQAMLQEDCITEQETGIRLYYADGISYYCAAMATAYGTEIGHAYKVYLVNGYEFNVIVADFKHDISKPRADDYGDPDINYDGQDCTNVIEFVVETKYLPPVVQAAGTMSALDDFGGLHGNGGDIAKIEDMGRRWRP